MRDCILLAVTWETKITAMPGGRYQEGCEKAAALGL